jgi:hypothetical protein
MELLQSLTFRWVASTPQTPEYVMRARTLEDATRAFLASMTKHQARTAFWQESSTEIRVGWNALKSPRFDILVGVVPCEPSQP